MTIPIEIERELMAMPEVQAMLGEKLEAMLSDVREMKISAARSTVSLMGVENEWIRYLTVELSSYELERQMKPIQREIDRVRRTVSADKEGIGDREIDAARKYPLDRLFPDLKGHGNRRTCLCPFHKETTPSCVVYVGQNLFHCYGCGAAGNAIDYLMRSEELPFMEAVKRLQ